jgi:hypothetical protein
MRPDKHEVKYKHFIKLEKELREVIDRIRSLPLIPYDKPVHKGWLVSYELRSDIKKRDDVEWIQKAIDIGYKPQYIGNVKHVRMMRAGERGYWHTNYKGKKSWVEFGPRIIWLKDKEYEKLHPAVQKYFYKPIWWEYPKYRDRYRIYIVPYWITPKARPNYLTHYQDIDGELESRKTWLKAKLAEYYRSLGGYHNKGWWRNQYRPQTRTDVRRFLKREIQDIPSVRYKTMIKR